MIKKTILAAFIVASIISCSKTMENPLLVKSNNQYDAPAFDKIKSEDFLPAFREAIKEADKEIAAIAENKEQPTFQNTIVALSKSGETLSSVSSIFFNLIGANTDTLLQKTAEEITPELTKHELSILFNDKLFKRVKAVYDKRNDLNLDIEDAKLLKETYKSFADNGANLSKDDKIKFQKIQEELSLATLKFGDNVLAATNSYILTITDSSDLSGLPDFVTEAAAFEAKQRNIKGWVFTLKAPSFGPFMQFSSKRNLREKIWTAYNTKCIGGDKDNRALISKIVDLRIQESKMLGYKSYSDYALKDRMAKNPGNVRTFLNDLLDKSLPFAKRDLKEIQAFAAKNGLKGELMPWDFSYYSEKLKKEKYSLDDEMLKPYFKLDNVQQAVFALADSLYGLKFIEIKNIPVYHKDVKVYDVKDTEGKHMALLYMDFFPRESKRGGAWMTTFREEYCNKEGKEVRPLVLMVMNFSKPTENEPSLLTFDEVTTLLHEFGHALHGILAQGKYASLTGTNVARDFVELPSQIMENWATEPAYLATFAKHYKTGEVIPQAMIDKIVESKNYLNGYYSIRQLAFGINDMAWHSLESVPADLDVIKFEKEATKNCNLLPVTNNTAFSTSFTHIFDGGYAAGYYSYKWAEVLEADAFQLFKEKGIFNKEVSNSFRQNILSKGSIEDADILYRNFRGRDPKTDALIEKLK